MIAANDPDEQEKILKFSTLLTNAVIFHTTLDMMIVVRELIADGWSITLTPWPGCAVPRPGSGIAVPGAYLALAAASAVLAIAR